MWTTPARRCCTCARAVLGGGGRVTDAPAWCNCARRYDGWVHPQTRGVCDSAAVSQRKPCFGAGWNLKNQSSCETAGCCWDPATPTTPAPGTAPPPACFQRSGNQDLYLLGHGLRYADALADFARISGNIPIPRRATLGVCWSRWGNTLGSNATMWEVEQMEAAGAWVAFRCPAVRCTARC